MGLFGSDVVGQLLSDSEWLGFIDSAEQVSHASRTPLL